ncbi:MAG: O-antigen ligase family protein [Nitrospiraceae bacterium]|nr:O-antigen ligase family protein [Nitrospiraceae bacterium]
MTTEILSGILILAALLFGSVEVWSSSLILFLVFTLGLSWVLRGELVRHETTRQEKILLAVPAALIAYGLVQIVPLPQAIVGVLSPAAYRVYRYYSVDAAGFMPLSLDTYRTTTELLKEAAFFIVFLIVMVNGKGPGVLRGMMRNLVVAGFCLSMFAIVQKATWNGDIYWFRELGLGGAPFGPFVNRNHFAGFIGMIVPLGLGLALTVRSREKQVLFGFMSVVMAVALCFSLSRGGITGFFAGVALFTFLMLKDRVGKWGVWPVGIFLIVLLTYLLYLGVAPIVERFYKTDVTAEQRLDVWLATVGAIRDYWFAGSGPGTFIDLFPLYAPAGIQSIYDHAHNDYLEFILENGAVGTLLLAAFAGLLISAAGRKIRGRAAVMRTAVLSALFSMAVHSFFDFNLHILSNALLFACLLGAVSALSFRAGEDEQVLQPAGQGADDGWEEVQQRKVMRQE